MLIVLTSILLRLVSFQIFGLFET